MPAEPFGQDISAVEPVGTMKEQEDGKTDDP
jgi:hypothetical protein